ncbi:uncharacterized protein [Dermacentor andersoni]|uniref:uncharacterized protein n=1 Tax=Dermacentor andersoni TaxID=34620 RepID=UPI0024170A6B|nr:uncharacterized protein LOC129386096 [Dermacentor andersoni]
MMYNEVSPQSAVGVLRAICLPSMKGGYYVVHAALRKDNGAVSEAHCLCPAGLSGTCQHVVGLLLTAASVASLEPTCTDLPCAWIVPPAAKKLEPSKPLKDIAFKVASPNTENASKRKRCYDPCPEAFPCDLDTFQRNLQDASPRALWLRYNKHQSSRHLLNSSWVPQACNRK